MTTYVFSSTSYARSLSGGMPWGLYYDQNSAEYFYFPDGTTRLVFQGNAAGTAWTDGIYGGAENDELTGLDGNDVFHGEAGADTLVGNGGDDVLHGGTGANVIDGGTGFDRASIDLSDRTENATALNTAIDGTSNTIFLGESATPYGSFVNIELMTAMTGGSGDDTLGGVYALSGYSATIDGGAGDDHAVVDLSGDVGGAFSGGIPTGLIYNQNTGYSLYLTSIERLTFTGNATGSAYSDGIFGGALADVLTGLGLDDALHGEGGDDTLTGADGNDRLYGGTGANTIDGGAGYDIASADFSDQTAPVVAVNPGPLGVPTAFTVGGKAHGSITDIEMMTEIVGGSGDDTLGGVYTLDAGRPHGHLAQTPSLSGGEGTDHAIVDLSADTGGVFSGGIPSGVIYNQSTGYSLSLSSIERLTYTGNANGASYSDGIFGGALADVLTGLDQDDAFHGEAGDDTLIGAGGNDRLHGGTGANTIDGGSGFDTASADFSDQTEAVVAVNPGPLGKATAFTVGGAAHGSITDIEMMSEITGGTGDDVLGGVYNLNGYNAYLTGGDGVDRAVVDLSADAAGVFSGGIPSGIIYNASTGNSLYLSMDALDFTGNATGNSYNTGIHGGAGDDKLTGLGGDDYFDGGAGNDTIAGAGGNDTLLGGTGANVLDGGAGFDLGAADFSDQTGAVVAINTGVAGVVHGFTVGGKAFGSVTNIEMMTGLAGGGGDDTLGGVYTLAAHSATLTGGEGSDTAVIDLSAELDGQFSGGLNYQYIYNNLNGQSLTLGGIERLVFTGNANGGSYGPGIYGGELGDELTGLDQNDVFVGNGGDDTLIGGKGDDSLTGGTGANILDGGEGYDLGTADFSDQTGAVVALNDGKAGVLYQFTVGGAKHGSATGIEMMTELKGGSGNDTLGGVYDLTKYFSSIHGGLGEDTAVVDLTGDPAGVFGGGIGAGRIYNNNIGYYIDLYDMERLDYIGSATGSYGPAGIAGGSLDDRLEGLDGNDTFDGGAGDDTLIGGKGDDTLIGGLGANILDGGEGLDVGTADFSDQTGAVVAINGGVAGVTYAFTVGGKAHGSVTGIELMSDLKGGSANDRLGGVYDLSKQTSYMDGGLGDDAAVVDMSGATGAAMSGGIPSGFMYDSNTGYYLYLTAIEQLDFIGNANGSYPGSGIQGGGLDDRLEGLDQNDIFYGHGGNDTLIGGKGDDRLFGGLGANILDGGEGFDTGTADFSDQTGDVDAVNLGVEGVTYAFTVGGKAHGSATGIQLMEDLRGGSGNDRLGGVYDLGSRYFNIEGGDGADLAVVDLSGDTAGSFSGGPLIGVLYNSTTGYSISLSAMERLDFIGHATGGVYNDGIAGGDLADRLEGLGGNDAFQGLGGGDTLIGNGGDDRLDGGLGANVLDGGADFDTGAADFSDQTGDVVAVNGGVPGVVYGFTVGGKAHGSVTNIEMMTSLTGGSGHDRLGGAYRLDNAYTYIYGDLGTDTAVVDLSGDPAGQFSGGLVAGLIYNDNTGYYLTLNSIEALQYTGNAVGGGGGSGISGGDNADILTGLDNSDTFRGGGGNDLLRGNGHNDSLFGDDGIDTAIFGGKFASYSFAHPALGQVDVTGPDGIDNLYDIEILQFDDGQVEVSGGKVGNSFTLSALSATVTEGHAGSQGATFTLSRTGPALITQTIAWTVAGSGGAPANAADFPGGVLPSGIATLAAGQSSVVITVPVAGDTLTEATEGFTLSLGAAPIGTTLAVASAAGTITNDDATLSIAQLSGDKAEGQGASSAQTFTVTRTGDTSVAHTASYAVTGSGATPAVASDFVGGTLPSGTVSFAPGASSATITVLVAPNTTVEPDEDFTVTLSGASVGATIGTAAVVGTILNDDARLSISATDASRLEGQSGSTALTFTVTREGFTGTAHTAKFSVAGSGANPAAAGDFAGGAFPSGTVSFAAGQTSRTITINVAGDTTVETDDGFTVTLASPSLGATLGTATAAGTILNDDAVLSISGPGDDVAEGQSGSSAHVFTVTRTGDLDAPMTAKFAVTGTGGDPANAADFVGGVLPSGTVSFAAGAAKATITIAAIGDTVVEEDEQFLVTLSAPTGGATIGTATAGSTIANDDSSFSIAPATVGTAEGNAGTTTQSFTVTRSGATGAAQTVAFGVAGSGANPAAAADFAGGKFPAGTLSFAAGQTSATISVPVAGDLAAEPDEGFTVTLSTPSAGATLGTASAAATIVNDDSAGSGTLSVARLYATRSEGQSATTGFTFTVTRSGDTSQTASASWSVAGGGVAGTVGTAGSDFAGGVLPSGTVSFAAGQTSQVITVPVAGDTAVELNESFTLTLASPAAGVTLGTATATGVVFNDDTAGTGTLSLGAGVTKPEGNSGSTAFVFTVTRSGTTTGTASADWAVTAGGIAGVAGIDGADMAGGALPTGRVNFAAGETSKTITVPIAGDTIVEPDESFTVTLGGLQAGVALGTASATGRVQDDDLVGSGTLSIARLRAARGEGQSGTTAFTFTVTRSGDTSQIATANWAVTGGGVSGTVGANAADFAGGALPSGTVSFAAGATSRTVTVNVAGDTAVELNESFTVTLANPIFGVALGTASATGSIFNDDTPGSGTLSIARAASQKKEGDSGSTAFTFTVTRSGDASATASADWVVTGGGVSATNGANAADFAGGVLPSGRVNFAAGATTQTVTVLAAGDLAKELNESFTVTLAAPQNGVALGTAAATGVILNDDFDPTGQLSIGPVHSARGEGQAGSTAFTFVVLRSGVTTGPASAKWTVTGGGIPGSASATGTDFAGGALPTGLVSFAPGVVSQFVTVLVAGDTAAESDESFTVTLSDTPVGVTLGNAATSGMIFNDEMAGTGALAIAATGAKKPEGHGGTTDFTFTVTRSGDASGAAAADWVVTGGGAAGTVSAGATDFATTAYPGGRVFLPPGQTSATITIPVVAEALQELNESFTVTLSAPLPGNTLATPAAAGVIFNDDLVSTASNQTLTGGTADDMFILGGGVDIVFGKGGADFFRFQPAAIGPAATSATTMEDFSRALGEVLDLSAIDAVAGGADNAFSFINTAAFSGVAGQLRWQDLGTSRLIQGDVNGDSTADLTIFVKAAGPVDSSWFVL